MTHERDPDASPSTERQDYQRSGMPPQSDLGMFAPLRLHWGNLPPEFVGGPVTFFAQDGAGQWFGVVRGAWVPLLDAPALPGKTIRGY